MSTQTDLPRVFEQLKSILKPYASSLTLKTDTPDTYYLDGPYSERWKKELFFGSAQIKKNYVSAHVMPVYAHPELLDGISPELRKRMQGKSCFNFKKVDEPLLAELGDLIDRGTARFEADGRL